jgi:Ni/Fe-hydrogenase 1 B-type cytochrome subunit
MKDERSRKYVWEFPVRFTHWINFCCILTLSFTGLYIGNPFIHADSSDQYIMGWIRFIHMVAAYAFLMSMIIRLYWSVMGNKYAKFWNWFPFSPGKISDILEELKFYLLISRKPPHVVGHTALGGFAMLVIFSIFIFEIISGFALYSVTHTGTIWTILGGWLTGIMYLPTIRLYHHLFMYLILAFSLGHIYIAWYSACKEENNLMISIFSGYKLLTGKERD